MKMRHFWRWPVLCSMLFGLASASASVPHAAPVTEGASGSLAAEGPARLAHEPRLHARVQTLRAALEQARRHRHRPAALRTLAEQVEAAADQTMAEVRPGRADESLIHALVAEFYAGADALRSIRKADRAAGFARIDGAVREQLRLSEASKESLS